MPSYFQSDNEEHLALLPKDLRTASDLEATAARAERDVISFYTRFISAEEVYSLTPVYDPMFPFAAANLGNGYYVFLRGYDPSPLDADDPLKRALIDTIADVIRWRLLQGKTNPMYQGQDKQAYAGTAPLKRFPPHWNRGLDLFDTRPPTLRI